MVLNLPRSAPSVRDVHFLAHHHLSVRACLCEQVGEAPEGLRGTQEQAASIAGAVQEGEEHGDGETHFATELSMTPPMAWGCDDVDFILAEPMHIIIMVWTAWFLTCVMSTEKLLFALYGPIYF